VCFGDGAPTALVRLAALPASAHLPSSLAAAAASASSPLGAHRTTWPRAAIDLLSPLAAGGAAPARLAAALRAADMPLRALLSPLQRMEWDLAAAGLCLVAPLALTVTPLSQHATLDIAVKGGSAHALVVFVSPHSVLRTPLPWAGGGGGGSAPRRSASADALRGSAALTPEATLHLAALRARHQAAIVRVPFTLWKDEDIARYAPGKGCGHMVLYRHAAWVDKIKGYVRHALASTLVASALR
jgi:hypothetical protein